MKTYLTLALSLALGSHAVAQDEPEKVVQTDLQTIRKNPDAYMNVWVAFDVQFASLGKIANPFFTKFVPGDYANFHGWGGHQPIWKKTEYDNVFGLLFMKKTNENLDQLYRVKMYDRMRIVGVVRNTFQGQPWIEVTSFSSKGGKVNTATLAHMYRGEQFMSKRQWKKAISELSLAPADAVPESVLAAVHKNLAVCYLRLGESGSARRHLETAVSHMPHPDAETKRLVQIAAKDPSKELDRTVNQVQVSDHERPMWEAFEEGQKTSSAATPR